MSKRHLPVLLLLTLLAPASSHLTAQPSSPTGDFSDPQPVTIRGYSGDAMEPFLTRDGHFLFFNNRNEAKTNTNLFWAERIDDLTFQFRGELAGVNTPALEAVASMDREGNFYFVSSRSYDQTASTLYRGRFADGVISAIELVPGISLAKPGIVNFDAEISSDGNVLYFVESRFTFLHRPATAVILFARRSGDSFVRSPESADMLRLVNNGSLNYAPAISPSGLELFFTRLDPGGPAIYHAMRSAPDSPFGLPRRIAAITGFAEAPTLSPDGRALLYHLRENGRFVLYRVTR